jgi:hypothetical protein
MGFVVLVLYILSSYHLVHLNPFNRHNQPLGGVSHTVAWAAGAVVGGPVSSRGTFNEGLFQIQK